MPALYGATYTGVRALLPYQFPDAEPSAEDLARVDPELEGAAARLFAAVGSLAGLPVDVLPELGLSVADFAAQLAKRAVEVDAASVLDASTGPERARPNDTTSYAQWLVELYKSLVAQLVALVDRYGPGDGVPVEGASVDIGEPAWSFPPAGVTETTGF